MRTNSEQISRLNKRAIIAAHAPDNCREYRIRTGMKQADFARALGVHAPSISALEKHGRVDNWHVAEAILMFAGLDFAKLGIEETPGLRAKCERYLRDGWAINVEFNEA